MTKHNLELPYYDYTRFELWRMIASFCPPAIPKDQLPFADYTRFELLRMIAGKLTGVL